jgi:hypothetical protein
MADLPSASVTIDDEAGAFSGSTGYAVVLGCVADNADSTPRVFASAKALLDQHGYSPAVDYAAMHIERTKKPIIFVGMATATAAVAGSHDDTGVTGTAKISVAAGADGYLEEVDAEVTVATGGTVGTDQIVLTLSLDGGRTEKTVRLGTATSYTIPYVGAVLSFTSGGTLVAGDVYTFRTTAPMWDSAGLTAARTALAAQLKQSRSWMVIGDVPNSTFAGYVVTEANAYETAHDRFVYARASVKDRLPLALKSKVKARMMGTPSLTFAEVGATGDTITRDTGSWVTEGFAVGDLITVSGTSSNDFTDAKITAVSATVLTLDTQDLVAETTAAAAVIGSESLTFAEVGSTGDTITRSTGSWTADGFAAGDTVVITGTASNNVTGVIDTVTATVLTLTTTDLAAEVIAGHRVTVTKSLTKAAWVAAKDSGFASIDAEKRVDLSLGRARKLSPITGWAFRRPASWHASIREYEHDVHIPCWRKADGPLSGVDLEDEDGNLAEFDERVDGGGLAGRFTCLRSYSNGPRGTFVALSLTRNTEGSLLSRTHNLAVANLACTIAQLETENAIGQVLVLKSDGTGTETSLSLIEERGNSSLQIGLLQDKGEGQRASKAVWRASRTDLLNVPAAELTGTLELLLNGTLEKITTRVRVQTAG